MNDNNVYVPYAHLESFNNPFTHMGPIVWNSLPDYINEIVYNELMCMILCCPFFNYMYIYIIIVLFLNVLYTFVLLFLYDFLTNIFYYYIVLLYTVQGNIVKKWFCLYVLPCLI